MPTPQTQGLNAFPPTGGAILARCKPLGVKAQVGAGFENLTSLGSCHTSYFLIGYDVNSVCHTLPSPLNEPLSELSPLKLLAEINCLSLKLCLSGTVATAV